MLYASGLEPFRKVCKLQGGNGHLFDQVMNESAGGMSRIAIAVDIREKDQQVVIQADLPGMELKDIDVHVENGYLTISGERKLEEEGGGNNDYWVERSYGRFSRTFQLPEMIDVANIGATYKNGVLDVTLPKLEAARLRSIAVQVH